MILISVQTNLSVYVCCIYYCACVHLHTYILSILHCVMFIYLSYKHFLVNLLNYEGVLSDWSVSVCVLASLLTVFTKTLQSAFVHAPSATAKFESGQSSNVIGRLFLGCCSALPLQSQDCIKNVYYSTYNYSLL